MDRPIQVLVVDDEQWFRENLVALLRKAGFLAEEAESGAQALAMLKYIEFDAAVLDFNMPGMDGRQTLIRMKRRHPDLEVVVLTGHASVDTATDMIESGAADFLLKPYDFENLADAIRQAVDRGRTERAAHT